MTPCLKPWGISLALYKLLLRDSFKKFSESPAITVDTKDLVTPAAFNKPNAVKTLNCDNNSESE